MYKVNMSDRFPDLKLWNGATFIDSHLCRICFSLSDLLIPIFEGEGVEQELCEKVEKYLPVKILPSDAFPQKLCYPCARTLIAWDSLFTICLKTNEILHSFLRKAKLSEANVKEKNLDDEVQISPRKKNLKNFTGKIKNIGKSSKCKKTKKIKSKSNKTDNKMNLWETKKNEVNLKMEENILKSEEIEPLLTVIKTEVNMEEDGIPNNSKTTSEMCDSYLINCEFCGRIYKNKKCLNRHVKKFHEEVDILKMQKCSVCSNIYKTKTNLERHYLKEHLTNQVQCPVCYSSFNSKKLDFHLKSIHGVKTESENEEKFKCKLCDKWFKNKYVRNSHMKEAHFSEPLKCKLCDYEGVRTALRRHKRDVHVEKKFVCSLCPGAFKTLHTLKMHMTSHSDIRCYTCDVCGMGFKRLNNVRDHMKCHEEKSNQCQICGNFFARKRYLAIHEKTIHNFYADGIVPEEKGFECGICGAKLKWKKNLLAHMRIHTGEKPYVCKICNKDFVCHGSLRTHMAKHSVCMINEEEPPNHVSVSIFNNINSESV